MKQEGFRLSAAQRRLWKLDAATARAVCALAVPDRVEASALRAALEEIVHRHEILRTAFVRRQEIKVPVQVIAEMEVPELDWTEETGDPDALFHRELVQPAADLEHGLRLRTVFVLPGRVLLLSMPAVCADGATLRRLAAELADLVAGEELEDPPQYVDAAEWQRERVESKDDDAERGRAHWRRQDLGLRPPPLPFEIAAQRGRAPATIAVQANPATAALLSPVAEAHGLLPIDVLRAAWWLTLRRLTGAGSETRLAVAEPFEEEALEGVFGPTSRWIPLQAALDDGLRFHQAAHQLARLRGEAGEWQRYLEVPETVLPYGFELDTWPAGAFTALHRHTAEPFGIVLSGVEQGGSIALELRFDPERLPQRDVARLARAFSNVLASALADPETRVGDLTLAPRGTGGGALSRASARGRDGEGSSAPAEEAPSPTLPRFAGEGAPAHCLGTSLAGELLASSPLPVHRRFEAQARLSPESPAVTGEDVTVSYGDLDAWSNRLAHALRRRGVGADTPVVLYLERSPALIAALLAVLKAGGAYVPFDTSQPARRIAMMLEEVRPPVVLTQESLGSDLPLSLSCILLDADREALSREPAEPLEDRSLPESLAYVIFTSGSTGRPKGVAVEHRQLCHYLDGVTHRFSLEPGWSWASVSTLAADLGHTALFPCLTTGGHLHLISQERASDPEALADYFTRHPIDGLKIVPTHLEALHASKAVLPRRRLILGGEASRRTWAEKLPKRPGVQVFNHYGPTETTVGVLTFPLDGPLDPRAATVPIGRPLPNAAVHLLDRNLQPVASWEPGEIYLGGPTVSRGYLGHPDLTADRFVPDPFSSGERLYRTGDLARLLPDLPGGAAVEFLGRRDHQVKYHGFRVELNEIRAALAGHPQIRESVVRLVSDGEGRDALIAYYVSRQEIDPVELRGLLSQTLAEEVVPNLFVHLRKLPLTLNGKIAYDALPGLDEVRAQAARTFVAPRTEAEAAVAEVWSQVLGIEKVSVDANFFELGGHSLLATRIISRLRERRGVDLPLRAIFESPTVAGLASLVEAPPSSAASPSAAGSGAIAASGLSLEDQLAELEELSTEEAKALVERQAGKLGG